ncbi:MAG TPA: trypsin-like peptidase domain-containing protein [Verrucomicrobiota bacterium]|nr:trypsin-like peptidase domain-containing protein [Verrucomicrobiota bacterium]HPU56739.1 trypsin-like peptidase domain-containing protein [Verrucomicrobiota bacterium]
MLRKSVPCLLLASLSAVAAGNDTIQLKDKAAITGRILAEKRDQVAVDVGYTVLVIPRNQIAKIVKDTPPPAEAATTAAAKSVASREADVVKGFYSTPAGPGTVSNVRDLVKQIGEAVVQVRTPGGLGSGFIINEEGFLITNFHVIEGETQISVEVYLQRGDQLERVTYKQVRIVALNKFKDLALLKIDDKDAPKFKYVVLGSSDDLSVGERVFAVGSPLGLERTVTEGILSTKTRQLQGELYLQTTAQINPGNSGGPLFNLAGEVIGITNMKVTSGEGLGFAIPIEAAKYFLDHRDAYAYSNDNPSNPYRYLEPPSQARQRQEQQAIE